MQILREHGVNYTVQRQVVWEYFAHDPHGRLISEAVTDLKAQGIGQATVYRTVSLFVDLGVLTRTADVGKTRYTAICPGHSHALICRNCHKAVEFDGCDLSELEQELTARTGYVIQGHHLEVFGTCPECRAAQADVV